MTLPSHKIPIDRYLNWDLVNQRLSRYENIGKFFKLRDLQDYSNKPPYYCHYLSWRLGTWENEQLFEFFDSLLDNASKLKYWGKDRIPQGREFENFWSLVWELQLARFFSFQTNTSVEWTTSGPDLKVELDKNTFFVECTVYRKSFGIEEFVSELIEQIHPSIRVRHRPFNIFSLPKEWAIESLLDELFKLLLDNIYLEEKINKAQSTSPVILPTPKGLDNFYLFIENSNARDFSVDQPWVGTGAPEEFLSVAVREILNNKRNSNNLKLHRPNLLAVNFLLGTDYQLAKALRNIPTPDLGEEFDAVFLTTCGIDEIPSLNNGVIHFFNNHPIKDYFNK